MAANLPILIIGAGVAGPALAISLHQKGYEVILFEKYDGPALGGASLNLAPNGLRVLDSLGLAEPLFTQNIASPVELLSYRTADGPLVPSGILSIVPKRFGFPFAGVKRSIFLKYLVNSVQNRGIDVRFSHSLTGLDQQEGSVTAVFENGLRVKGSFVVGCDGLHSNTRVALFGRESAEYTGLTQTAGMTRVPRRIRHLQNLFADNIHMISYAAGVKTLDTLEDFDEDTTLISWAVTRQEAESRESWKAEAGNTFRDDLVDTLDFEWADGISAKELINGAPEIIKFGLYDRKELSTWYKGRVVLIGDAAHPTSPHLGQGANQALEDVSSLTAFLTAHIPASHGSPATALLTHVFNELDALRIPRTSTLVGGAREMGRLRVLPAESRDAEDRNKKIKEEWSQPEEKLLVKFEELLGPRARDTVPPSQLPTDT